LHRRLSSWGLKAKLLLQIHDELLSEVSPEDASRLSEMVREEMTSVAKLRVPLKVEIGIGRTWAEV
ncbi:MAG: DNA polymerase, partial [Planctomycetaceae bacterium]